VAPKKQPGAAWIFALTLVACVLALALLIAAVRLRLL